MPIPALDANGLLPMPVHDCTLDEIEEVFGNDRWVENKLQPCRSKLYRRLCEYLAEVSRLNFLLAVLIDGSFVTD
jgi:hypothetical protein